MNESCITCEASLLCIGDYLKSPRRCCKCDRVDATVINYRRYLPPKYSTWTGGTVYVENDCPHAIGETKVPAISDGTNWKVIPHYCKECSDEVNKQFEKKTGRSTI